MSKMFDKIKNSWEEITQKMLNDNEEISPTFFEAFIKNPINLLKYEKDTLYLEVPEEGYIKILKKRYIPDFLKISIAEVLDIPLSSFNIEFITRNNPILNKQNISNEILEKRLKQLKINPLYTFENFVESESNNLAFATSKAIAEKPGELYNPLIIYGDTGLGKTHLLHAITHFFIKNNENFAVIYISCQDFTTEYIQSTKNNCIDDFKYKYKNIDALIIDDIQFISGKNETQNILFDIFNELYGNNKQIILSSDRPVNEIDKLQDRIKSRFSWGISCDVKPPDYETRIAILRKKVEVYKPEFSIDDEILRYIAQNVKTNIRALEGCLNKIIAKSRLDKKPITLAVAKDLLTDYAQEENKKITPERIIDTVSEYLGVDKNDICGKKKTQEFVYARNLCIYLCRDLIQDITQEKIGEYLGGRDHSTILHGYNKIDKDMKINKHTKENIEELKKRLFIN